MKMVSKTIGRCVSEYKREDFDQVVKNYTKFYSVSQFTYNKPTSVSMLDGYAQPLNEPRISIGNILFGVEQDGSLTELVYLIDSSD
jgi:hypothetical protein